MCTFPLMTLSRNSTGCRLRQCFNEPSDFLYLFEQKLHCTSSTVFSSSNTLENGSSCTGISLSVVDATGISRT